MATPKTPPPTDQDAEPKPDPQQGGGAPAIDFDLDGAVERALDKLAGSGKLFGSSESAPRSAPAESEDLDLEERIANVLKRQKASEEEEGRRKSVEDRISKLEEGRSKKTSGWFSPWRW